uniref:No apical meristem-associated C-terminal domain-containing protein n=1 Tax=Leersia perrieri TaxID=77586 RepID=A0A0D9WYD8_9ORYZ
MRSPQGNRYFVREGLERGHATARGTGCGGRALGLRGFAATISIGVPCAAPFRGFGGRIELGLLRPDLAVERVAHGIQGEMDPAAGGSFLRFLQDPAAGPNHLKALVEAKDSQREEVEAIKIFQEKLANRRQETANTNRKADLEMKEAKKIEAKNKSMEMLTQMLQLDTSGMDPWTKQVHDRALAVLAEQALGAVHGEEAN